MKRILCMLCSLMLCASGALAGDDHVSTNLIPACYRYLYPGLAAICSDADVTVWRDASLTETIAAVLSPGTEVHVRQADYARGVVCITLPDGSSGWARNTELINDPYTGPCWVVVTDKPGDRLNLRQQPSRSATPLGKYYAGTIAVELEPPRNGWVKVRIGHAVGYFDLSCVQPGLACSHPELPILTVQNAGGTGANLRL